MNESPKPNEPPHQSQALHHVRFALFAGAKLYRPRETYKKWRLVQLEKASRMRMMRSSFPHEIKLPAWIRQLLTFRKDLL